MRRNLAYLFLILALSTAVITASPPTFKIQLPRVHATSFSLFGSKVTAPAGWGLTAASISSPGPTLTVVKGDTVTITLDSVDGIAHNWGIDYNGDSSCEAASEPCSGSFGGTNQNPIMFTFTVTANPGTYTYYCFIHHAPMLGTFVVKSAFSLFGNAGVGWGSTSSNIATPGPTLVAPPGTLVTMTLNSADGFQHNWGIDYNGDEPSNFQCDAGDVCSPPFGGPSPSTIQFSFTTTPVPGNYTYYCFIHFAPMIGTFVIRDSHDVAVSLLATSRNFAYNGVTTVNPIHVNVTAQNLGLNPETFAVYAKANSTLIFNQTITVASGGTQVVTFNWANTGTLARGHYVLTANATRVNGETNFANNQLTGGTFKVKLKGDVDGDCLVDLTDLILVAARIGTTPASPNWLPAADLENDFKMDLTDIILVASNFMASVPTC